MEYLVLVGGLQNSLLIRVFGQLVGDLHTGPAEALDVQSDHRPQEPGAWTARQLPNEAWQLPGLYVGFERAAMFPLGAGLRRQHADHALPALAPRSAELVKKQPFLFLVRHLCVAAFGQRLAYSFLFVAHFHAFHFR